MRVALGPNIAPSQRRNERSGAKGTRTPDLLVAKVSSVGDKVDDPRESTDETVVDDV
jgi:hypothetical protein